VTVISLSKHAGEEFAKRLLIIHDEDAPVPFPVRE
jgi:hypothetical protein